MKRYDPDFDDESCLFGDMVDDPNGEWVKWDEADKRIMELEDENYELKVRRAHFETTINTLTDGDAKARAIAELAEYVDELEKRIETLLHPKENRDA